MCQNVPSLDEPVSPLAWSSYAESGPDHQGRRTPSLIMSRKTGSPSVCDPMPGLIGWSRREKSNRLRSATGWT
jgi:hypothetical protein